MATITLTEPLPFDIGADWLSALTDLLASVKIESASSSQVVIAGRAGTAIAGYRVVVLPQTSFGLTLSSPFVSGVIGEVRLLDPTGAQIGTISGLGAGATIAAVLDGSYFSSLAMDLLGSFGDDSVTGGAGQDTLSGGAGLDLLKGDAGDDSLSGGGDFDYLQGNMGADTLAGGEGGDWVVGGKDGDRLSGDAGSDVVLGNLGNDTLEGGDDLDVIRGGQGDDLVLGGAGNDWISGDRGADTMTGGSGADIFHTFDGAGVDRVTDFNAADGDRVYLLPGTQYSVAQVGADTVITVTGAEGGQIVLSGVTLGSLPAGWIFGV
ncbi:calcium-binding protein [Phenylobacterium sp.]|jgi:Ca2+-binding RTX toxin-like protein|uniref:calcium-binding protein n=1 Tax=Phenylobacterium sp. TaxID=1871053 RepID=UPI002F937FD2